MIEGSMLSARVLSGGKCGTSACGEEKCLLLHLISPRYSNYSWQPSELTCTIAFCDNATDAPNVSGANYNFKWNGKLVALGGRLTYPCKDGMRVLNQTEWKNQSSSGTEVYCGADGEWIYPPTWPQCSRTTYCPAPPSPPTNDPRHADTVPAGTRTWIGDLKEPEHQYLTKVAYRCTQGSQFDTDSDGVGDTLELQTTCKWMGVWEPWASLPPCLITHCIWPPEVPTSSYKEEVTTDWTPVNTSKQYRCKGMKGDGTHTRFWESDRTKSTLSIPCMANGLFDFVDEVASWPVCLEDITCSEDPPEIPTHPDYSVIHGKRRLRGPGLDDGRVTFQSLLFPEETNHNSWLNSTANNSSLVPRNYLAKLT